MDKINIKNKTVLALVDFFLPMEHILPTITALAARKNRVIVVSYFDETSLANHAGMMAEALRRKFIILHDSITKLPEYDIPHLYFARNIKLLPQMRAGDIAVLENLAFFSKEQIIQLKGMVQLLVNDFFGAPEEAVKLLAKNLPVQNGLEFTRTQKNLELFSSRGKKPFVLILGGARMAGKETLIDKLMRKADTILVGGGAANLFFKLQGLEVGKSFSDASASETLVKKMRRDYKSKIKLPVDVIVSTDQAGSPDCIKPEKVKIHQMILDIGPATTLEFSKFIKDGRTLVWLGALGHVEQSRFKHGTAALLRLFASRSPRSHTVIAASGETVLPILQSEGFLNQMDLAIPNTLGLLTALTK